MSILLIHSTTQEDAGDYECKVSNELGVEQCNATVNISG